MVIYKNHFRKRWLKVLARSFEAMIKTKVNSKGKTNKLVSTRSPSLILCKDDLIMRGFSRLGELLSKDFLCKCLVGNRLVNHLVHSHNYNRNCF
ncbi:hypothetical protein COE15_07380 [Bacillus cereus]|nr:hypothetical protein CN288_05955 [Bacillus sp. AFS023182]PGY03093.1 hypothetical protein COE15_07380 [Bacillus cereus]